ncbi:MAG: hypothetical protein A3G75_02785 [Verrucomicrobia bacterium RIFCSPLOWO2_12_FULL_64_8]|nr:MAG: hypothetical protein A3G75_02785 [Verrucomicrobia bacterium RIFCSPLOWO2_12_FULL_64_8]
MNDDAKLLRRYAEVHSQEGKSASVRPLRPGRRIAAPAALAALLAGLAGCSTSYEMKVDALTKPTAREALSYRVKTAGPEIQEDTLRYKEAAAIVRTALSGKGMYEAPAAERADVVVTVDYGIGPPRTVREKRYEPIYRERPGRFRTKYVRTGTDRKGNAIYSAVTVRDPPELVYVGDRVYWVTYVVYEKYIHLTARENKPASEGRPAQEVWSLSVSTEDESKDLRKYLPIMASAGIDYVGKDSGGSKTITIKTNDRALEFLKRNTEELNTGAAPAAGSPPAADVGKATAKNS